MSPPWLAVLALLRRSGWTNGGSGHGDEHVATAVDLGQLLLGLQPGGREGRGS